MNMLDRVIAQFAPGVAAERMRNRLILQAMTMRYDAATSGNRGGSWHKSRADADNAARQRDRLAFVARDMVRNTAFAGRAKQVIANNVVGDGIIPKVMVKGSKAKAEALQMAIEAHFDTTAIDVHGRQNLYGLQRLAVDTVVESGEVLVMRHRRSRTDGFALPFQIEVMEPDFFVEDRDGLLPSGGEVRDGIEYNAAGQRTHYHLYEQHPGAMKNLKASSAVRRVPASEVLHIYRQDRPGQMRGVSWFAPVAMLMQDQADMQDAQLMRQKIAACFAAFRHLPEAETPAQTEERAAGTLVPGRIESLLPGEEITFSTPPAATGYDEFSRNTYRAVAAGMGITYEALTGDLSNVNFSSARMGRAEMNRNVSGWQWLMMVPQFLQPLALWAIEGFQLLNGPLPKGSHLTWVPPYRELVDPTREIPALVDKIRAGLASRHGTIRELGFDPEKIDAELKAEMDKADALGLTFDTDARTARAGAPATVPADDSSTPAKGKADGEGDAGTAAGGMTAQAVMAALQGMPAPVVNVAAPVVTVNPAEVRAGDVHVHMPPKGAVRKIAEYDEQGRITAMREEEIPE